MEKGALDYQKVVALAEALVQKRQWSEMAICSAPLTELLSLANSAHEMPIKIEDDTYLKNATQDLKLAKAFDTMDFAHYAYKHALKAFRTMEALSDLRKGQNEGTA